ncbi:MAG: anthrone oxygenase family protein [Pseudomonadota bacterium]
MLTNLALFLCIGAGTIGGVFFAFSSFVMKALAQLPASQGIAAMQRINVVVLNPMFLGVFIGTALLALTCVVLSFLPWSAPRSPLLLASGLLYVVGSFLVAVAFNVPRNDRLAGFDAQSPEAAAYWPTYVLEWTRWNHVRTAASIASAACVAGALAI